MSRNPLKSGQCFLLFTEFKANLALIEAQVAIPSNRVNVSYVILRERKKKDYACLGGRNPLKSGQCFLHGQKSKRKVI